jgi:hypothetical protein
MFTVGAARLGAPACFAAALVCRDWHLVPRLWADPLGPTLKIWPVLVLNLVATAVREDR